MATNWKKDLAVALSYDRETTRAPKIVGTGERKLAGEMKKIARRYGIPIRTNPHLVKQLSALEMDMEVPEDLFDELAQAWLSSRKKG